MTDKKLCTIGILNIEMNLVLTESQAKDIKFDIEKYNSVEDLKNLFMPEDEDSENINYYDYLTLSSENSLINTLLFINRANKVKTFIEFIMPNQMNFSLETEFVKTLLQNVFNKNYLYIIENKIADIPSHIKFQIKIVDDSNEFLLNSRVFELFEMNEINTENEEKSEENNNNIEETNDTNINPDKLLKMKYDFSKTEYFILEYNNFKDLGFTETKQINSFIKSLLHKHPKLKIILLLNDSSFEGYQFTEKLIEYKDLLELGDIIFAPKELLNNFLKTYNSIYDKKEVSKAIKNANSLKAKFNEKLTGKNKNDDLIQFDIDKHRKLVERVSILFDKYKTVTVYTQKGGKMEVNFNETFYLKIEDENINMLSANEKYYFIFIGGFLSRYLNGKTFRVCAIAGEKILNKCSKLNKNKNCSIIDINKYNVLVPKLRQNKAEKYISMNDKEKKILEEKEKNFVLDCTNVILCQKKYYNPLLDINCSRYLNTNFNLLHKGGFVNRKGDVLKEPENYPKVFILPKTSKSKSKFSYNNLTISTSENNIKKIDKKKASETEQNSEIKNSKTLVSLNNIKQNVDEFILPLLEKKGFKKQNYISNSSKKKSKSTKKLIYPKYNIKESKNYNKKDYQFYNTQHKIKK